VYSPIPVHGVGDRGGKGPAGLPAHLVVDLVDLQVQTARFMWGLRAGEIKPLAWPVKEHLLDQFLYGAVGLQ
jgi:hypothetical protein